MRPERVFLFIALAAGSAFVLLTPPFGAPDEPAHFYRAWDVSEGRLRPRWVGGHGGADLPASLAELAKDLGEGVHSDARRTIEPSRIRAALGRPLEPDRRIAVDFSNTSQFPFVAYAPQAVGIALGRLAGASPLGCFYAGRFANLLAAAVLTALAIRAAPAFRWFLTLVALMPTAVFLRASLSADALTTACALWLAALVARAAFGPDGAVTVRRAAVAGASAAVLWLTKPPYGLLCLAALIVPRARWAPGARARGVAVYGAASTAAALLMFEAARHLGERVAFGGPRRFRWILRHPLAFLLTMAGDYWQYGFAYALQAVGQLGWLDTKLPTPWRVLYLLVLLGVLAVDGSPSIRVARGQRAALAALTLALMALISASQYVLTAGVQGRYFIPLAGTVPWIFHAQALAGRAPPWLLPWGTAAFSAATMAIALRAVQLRFYP